MKQNKTRRRISFLVVAILLITISALSMSLAKYASTQSGDAQINIAKWEFGLDQNSDSAVDTGALSLTPVWTQMTNVAPEKLAPGMDGAMTLKLLNKGDVKVNYSVKFSISSADLPEGVKFYQTKTGSSFSDLVALDTTTETGKTIFTFTGTLDIGSTTVQTEDLNVYLVWDFEDSSITDYDSKNVAKAGSTLIFTVDILGEQVQPA